MVVQMQCSLYLPFPFIRVDVPAGIFSVGTILTSTELTSAGEEAGEVVLTPTGTTASENLSFPE